MIVLSDRKSQVVILVCMYPEKEQLELAQLACMSEEYLNTCLKTIRQKFDSHSRTDLCRKILWPTEEFSYKMTIGDKTAAIIDKLLLRIRRGE